MRRIRIFRFAIRNLNLHTNNPEMMNQFVLFCGTGLMFCFSCVLLFLPLEAEASSRDKKIVYLNCVDRDSGEEVSSGNECTFGRRACIPNPCPGNSVAILQGS